MKRLLNKKLIGVLLALSLITAILVPNLVPDAVELVGDSFTVGTVEAAGVADATCDGAADDVQAQALLTALPATGGRISILTGTYVWANATTVTRAIDGVTIVGTGVGTSVTGDAVTAPFTAGGNNWVIQDLQTDVTAAVLLAAMGATTDWEWRNVTTSDVYFAYRTDDATTAVSWDIPSGRTATYTVVASDASVESIAQADYVCDGTADEVEINAAIAAISDGEVLQLLGPTFNIAAQVNITKDIVFDMGKSTLIAGTNLNDTVIQVTATNDATLINGIIDGNKLNQSATCYGIYVVNAVDTTVTNVRVQNTQGYGIRAVNSNRVIFVNNIVTGVGTGAVDGAYDGIGLYRTATTTGHSIISGNLIFDIADEGISVDDGTEQIIISNNVIRSARNGIGANNHDAGDGMPGGALTDILITGNNIYSSSRSGIVVHGNPEALAVSSKIIISNNIIRGTGATYYGIDASGWIQWVEITNNYVSDVAGYGIRAIGLTEDATTTYPLITRIEGNTVYRTGTPNGKGIYVVADDIDFVCNNEVVDWNGNTSDAISINGLVADVLEYVTITGNKTYVSSGTGTNGIELYYVTYSLISDNMVVGRAVGGAYGILEATGCDYNTFTNNDVRGIVDATKFVKTGANTIVRENFGYVTENSGSATLLNANTTIVVAHGCAVTPTVILITFKENPDNLMADWWVDTVGAVNFTFNGVDPGASNLDFYWEAKVR